MIKLIEKALAAQLLPENPEEASLESVRAILQQAQIYLTEIAGGVAICFLIYGGILYFTAYGNEERASQGKKVVYWTIIGMAVILLAEVIVTIVWSTITPATFEKIH